MGLPVGFHWGSYAPKGLQLSSGGVPLGTGCWLEQFGEGMESRTEDASDSLIKTSVSDRVSIITDGESISMIRQRMYLNYGYLLCATVGRKM